MQTRVVMHSGIHVANLHVSSRFQTACDALQSGAELRLNMLAACGAVCMSAAACGEAFRDGCAEQSFANAYRCLHAYARQALVPMASILTHGVSCASCAVCTGRSCRYFR